MKIAFRLGYAAAGALLAVLGAAPAVARPQYAIARTVNLPGSGGWDALTVDPGGHRLFIAHGTQVDVIDTERLNPVGTITDTPGVHAIALAPELRRGYVSAGGSDTVVVFDLATLARLKDIKTTGANPDAILYEPGTRQVFAFNGRGRNVTVIDAATETVTGTIALDGKPEFAVGDGQGRLYVNLEDKNSVAVIDARTLALSAALAAPRLRASDRHRARCPRRPALLGVRQPGARGARDRLRPRARQCPDRRRRRWRRLRPERAARLRLLWRGGAEHPRAPAECATRGRAVGDHPARRAHDGAR